MGIMLYHVLSLYTASFGSNLSSLEFEEAFNNYVCQKLGHEMIF